MSDVTTLMKTLALATAREEPGAEEALHDLLVDIGEDYLAKHFLRCIYKGNGCTCVVPLFINDKKDDPLGQARIWIITRESDLALLDE